MRITAAALLTVLAAASARSAEPVARDIAYDAHDLTKLDVYATGEGDDRPVVVWVHGGGWRRGDKANVGLKPAAFNAKGYVLVSVNYRLHPAATYREQASDVAKAIRWARDHAAEHRGSPERIFLMGHSAGAHLAALVATDGGYLEAVGLKPSDLSGVVLLDGAGYDIPRQIRESGRPAARVLYGGIFGEDEAAQREASPIAHVEPGKRTSPFLILHVADRPDSKAQSEALAAKLRGAGAKAEVVPAEGKTHGTINRDLGRAGDPPTEKVFEFLKAAGRSRPSTR